MSDHELTSSSQHLVATETIEATAWMQAQCIAAYQTVTASLRSGMTEADISMALIEELRGRGISHFWYDIPAAVLIGGARFMQMIDQDYELKRPSAEVVLQAGQPIFIDIHPQHPAGQWGNFAATGIFEPDDTEAVLFLKLMQQIQGEGIAELRPDMTGSDVAGWFRQRFEQEQIQLVDVRSNFGHHMGRGPKVDAAGVDRRLFLDEHNETPIAGRIWGIEPSGIRKRSSGNGFVIARFEDCVYISPQGQVVILGGGEAVPLVFGKG